MARPEKVAEVQAISDRLRQAKSLVLVDYTGLSVEKLTAFRSLCRSKGVECRVVKNRLAMIAAGDAGLEVLQDHLKGPTALVLGPASQVEPAKVAVDFGKDNERLRIKGGLVEGEYLTPARVVALSRTPSREELLAKMMGSINSPATGLAMCVSGVAAALARALDAVAKQKQDQQAA